MYRSWQTTCLVFICFFKMVRSDCGEYDVKFYRVGHNQQKYHTFCSDVCAPWINPNYIELCWDDLVTRRECIQYVTCLTATTTKSPKTDPISSRWSTAISTPTTDYNIPATTNYTYLLLIGVPVLFFIIIIAVLGFIAYKCNMKGIKSTLNKYFNHHGGTVIENKDNIPEGQELIEMGNQNMNPADRAVMDIMDEDHKRFQTAATVRGKQVQTQQSGELFATAGQYPGSAQQSFDTDTDLMIPGPKDKIDTI